MNNVYICIFLVISFLYNCLEQWNLSFWCLGVAILFATWKEDK